MNNKRPWKKGETVGYHGREGVVRDYADGGVIIYFPDIDEEDWIDIEELMEQEGC